jgi:hypothetical protein
MLGDKAVCLYRKPVRIEEDLIDQLFNSSQRRLARMLLLLANFGKEGSPQPISLKISQETLAEMIGTTRSRVSHFMNKFRKLGLVDYNGHIEVHNSLLGAVLHDKPLCVPKTLDPTIVVMKSAQDGAENVRDLQRWTQHE